MQRTAWKMMAEEGRRRLALLATRTTSLPLRQGGADGRQVIQSEERHWKNAVASAASSSMLALSAVLRLVPQQKTLDVGLETQGCMYPKCSPVYTHTHKHETAHQIQSHLDQF